MDMLLWLSIFFFVSTGGRLCYSYGTVARDLSLKTVLRPRMQPKGELLFSMINPMAIVLQLFYILPDWSDTRKAHDTGSQPNLATSKA